MEKLKLTSEAMAEKLDQTRWASEFSWDQMKRMVSYFEAWSVSEGECIFEQGVPDQAMGVLLSGLLHVVRVHEGRQSRLAVIRAPQTFGELSLIDGQPRSASIVAAAPVEFLMLTRNRLEAMAKDYPLVAYRLLWKIAYLMSQRLRSTSGQLAEYLEPQ